MSASEDQWVMCKISDSEIVDALRAARRPLQKDELLVSIFLARCDTHDCTKKEFQRLLYFFEFLKGVDTQSFFSLFWKMVDKEILYLERDLKIGLRVTSARKIK